MTSATVADHELARTVAHGAGQLLLELRQRLSRDGCDPDVLRSQGDHRSQVWIAGQLARHCPDDAVLSEEAEDSPERLRATRVWIVDPLDGTREFGEPGRRDWAVHVALVIAGAPCAGAVALPAAGVTIGTAAPPPRPPRRTGPPRLLVSRTRPPPEARILADRLGAEWVPMGSAGAKAMAVVLGDGDIYAHSGGLYEWDAAAPTAVAAAAGLHVSRLDGSPLRYNQASPWLPDLLICRPHLTAQVLAALE
jgi:3'(2'), 5'-bisphosphate nucleotidase